MSTSPDRSAEAEAEAEAVRAGLVETLSQLRENLRPANMVDEVISGARIGASSVSEQVWSVARRNPLPAMLIGAGAAMLLGLGVRSGGSPPDAPAPNPPDPAGTEHGPGRLPDEANERLHDMAARGADTFNAATANAKGSESMNWSRQRVGTSLSHLIEEQPLILGALGVALGAAIGAALPHTRTEDGLLGQASGTVRAAARDLMHEQVEGVRAAASHAVEGAKQAAAAHGVNTENLSGLAHDVGEQARAATFEAGRAINRTT